MLLMAVSRVKWTSAPFLSHCLMPSFQRVVEYVDRREKYRKPTLQKAYSLSQIQTVMGWQQNRV